MIRVVSIFALSVLAASAFAADKPVPDSRLGQKVGPVALTKLDGSSAKLDELRGEKATVLVFVSFECPVSIGYLAQLNDLAKDCRQNGVVVLAICAGDETANRVRKQVGEFKLSIPTLLDPKKELVSAMKASATPEAFVLDGTGAIRYRGRIDDAYSARLKRNPAVTSFDLKNALEDVLAGKEVRTPVTKPIGCPIDSEPTLAAGTSVTYHRDIAPILKQHCQVCHQPGEVGPFPLLTYKQARRWASDIKEYTASKQMPPWMPASGVSMRGERKLSEKEIATIAAWVDAGSPEGEGKDAPLVAAASGWHRGQPDLVLSPGEPFHLAATGRDLFRCFVIPTGLTENRWVVGFEVKPGNTRVVHHTVNFFDASGTARKMEQTEQSKERSKSLKDHGPGYSVGMGVGFLPPGTKPGEVPRFGAIGGWAPGQSPQFLPEGAGWLFPKESDFILQTHYHRDGKEADDQSKVGFYFAKGPIQQPWQTIVIAGLKPIIDRIPAGRSDYKAHGWVYLHTDAILHNVMPHMHLLGKSVKITMTPPGGEPVTIVAIPHWDYNWQETYWFKEPINAKAGTKLEIEGIFDNSAANPNNPSHPPRTVTYGEETTDEMLFGFIGATSTKTPFERIRFRLMPPESDATGFAPAEGKMTPVLEQRLGKWDTETTVKIFRSITKETKITGSETVEKAFNGTFIRASTKGLGSSREVMKLSTYDPAKKCYRLWLDDPQTLNLEWTGTWDEQAKVLTWKSIPGSNVNAVFIWRFPTADRFEWDLKIGAGDKVVVDMEGVMKKKS